MSGCVRPRADDTALVHPASLSGVLHVPFENAFPYPNACDPSSRTQATQTTERSDRTWTYSFEHLSGFPGFRPNEMTKSGCHVSFDETNLMSSSRLDMQEAIGVRATPP
jgi:hypothetical protein